MLHRADSQFTWRLLVAERNETLTTDKSVDDALRAGTQTLESLGLTVKQAGSGSLEAKAGNKLLVYWIGLYLPTSKMPVKVNFNVTENAGSRTIQMHTESSVFLSFYFWKYKRRANEIADALSQGVASKLGQSAPPPDAG
jgi:hypothetical protein